MKYKSLIRTDPRLREDDGHKRILNYLKRLHEFTLIKTTKINEAKKRTHDFHFLW